MWRWTCVLVAFAASAACSPSASGDATPDELRGAASNRSVSRDASAPTAPQGATTPTAATPATATATAPATTPCGTAFGAPTSYGVGTFPQQVVARDFDGDGRTDLVVADNNGF